ncbi:hypothetical protein LTR56_016855 [Elasticomyces elasticus]|nr:hypothetical protein LTR56_016855 [Elasticomyces elasticus]KAK3666659.1 hypothetical protein LTR22_002608 [Elasticomyces elasticus]
MNSISSRAGQPPYLQLDHPAGNSLHLTLYVGIHDLGRSDNTDQLGIIVTADTTFPQFKDMVEECYLRHWLPEACYAYCTSMRWDATFGSRVLEKSVARLWRWTQDHLAAQKDSGEPSHELQNLCILQTITKSLDSCEKEGEAYECEWYVRQDFAFHQHLTSIRLPIAPPPPRPLVPDVILWAALGPDWDETEAKVEQEKTPTSRQRVKGVLRRVFGTKRREETSSCMETERQDEKQPA